MPKILDDAVRDIRTQNPNVSKSQAYAMATDTLQKSGSLRKGTDQPTKQGVQRGQMSRAERQRNPPARR